MTRHPVRSFSWWRLIIKPWLRCFVRVRCVVAIALHATGKVGTQEIEISRDDLLSFRFQMSEYPGHVNDIVENDCGRHQVVVSKALLLFIGIILRCSDRLAAQENGCPI